MPLKRNQVVSAQVVMRSASGKAFDGKSIITSKNVEEFAPSADAVARVAKWFAKAGFKTDPLVGISFSIAAPTNTFESVFKTRLRDDQHGGIHSVAQDDSVSYELPLKAIPKDIAERIISVTFTPPPDFGPVSFGP